MSEKFVVVCTEKRGVFAGYTENSDCDPIKFRDLQMCVYWSSGVRGVVGLAATGPTKSCRVTKPAPSGDIVGITAVFECSPDAEKAWLSCPWG